jgi:hypothetical protein
MVSVAADDGDKEDAQSKQEREEGHDESKELI